MPQVSSHRSLPESTAWLFPEYEFSRMDDEGYANVIIERILERGSWDQLRWMFARYGRRRVAMWLRQHGFRRLSPRSFEYWRWVLGIRRYNAPPWAAAARSLFWKRPA
jgi:hypothetical protein